MSYKEVTLKDVFGDSTQDSCIKFIRDYSEFYYNPFVDKINKKLVGDDASLKSLAPNEITFIVDLKKHEIHRKYTAKLLVAALLEDSNFNEQVDVFYEFLEEAAKKVKESSSPSWDWDFMEDLPQQYRIKREISEAQHIQLERICSRYGILSHCFLPEYSS